MAGISNYIYIIPHLWPDITRDDEGTLPRRCGVCASGGTMRRHGITILSSLALSPELSRRPLLQRRELQTKVIRFLTSHSHSSCAPQPPNTYLLASLAARTLPAQPPANIYTLLLPRRIILIRRLTTITSINSKRCVCVLLRDIRFASSVDDETRKLIGEYIVPCEW